MDFYQLYLSIYELRNLLQVPQLVLVHKPDHKVKLSLFLCVLDEVCYGLNYTLEPRLVVSHHCCELTDSIYEGDRQSK